MCACHWWIVQDAGSRGRTHISEDTDSSAGGRELREMAGMKRID